MIASQFVLIQSNQKSSHPPIGGFFAAQGLCRTNHEKPWAAIFLPRFALAPTATCKKLLCPARPRSLAGFSWFFAEAVLLTKRVTFLSVAAGDPATTGNLL